MTDNRKRIMTMSKTFMFLCNAAYHICPWLLFFFCIPLWGYSIKVVTDEYDFFFKKYTLLIFTLSDLKKTFFKIPWSFICYEQNLIYTIVTKNVFSFGSLHWNTSYPFLRRECVLSNGVCQLYYHLGLFVFL